MSTICNQNDPCSQAAADIFTWFLQVSRQAEGLAVEEAAHRAGMGSADWRAIEAGEIPAPEKLQPMADALDLRVDQLAILDRIRRKG
jgi:hypothetical protein